MYLPPYMVRILCRPQLAKFSKLNFLGVGCSLDELLEQLFLNLGSYFYLVYSIWSKLQFIQCSKFLLTLQKILDTNQIWCELMKFSGFDFDF